MLPLVAPGAPARPTWADRACAHPSSARSPSSQARAMLQRPSAGRRRSPSRGSSFPMRPPDSGRALPAHLRSPGPRAGRHQIGPGAGQAMDGYASALRGLEAQEVLAVSAPVVKASVARLRPSIEVQDSLRALFEPPVGFLILPQDRWGQAPSRPLRAGGKTPLRRRSKGPSCLSAPEGRRGRFPAVRALGHPRRRRPRSRPSRFGFSTLKADNRGAGRTAG